MFEESDYEVTVSLFKFPLSAQCICIFSQFPISVTHVYRSVYKWNDMMPKICFPIHPQKVGARDERQLDTCSSLFKVGNGYRMTQSLYDSLYFYLSLKLSIIKSLKTLGNNVSSKYHIVKERSSNQGLCLSVAWHCHSGQGYVPLASWVESMRPSVWFAKPIPLAVYSVQPITSKANKGSFTGKYLPLWVISHMSTATRS